MWRGVGMKSRLTSWHFGKIGCGIPVATTAALGLRDDGDGKNKLDADLPIDEVGSFLFVALGLLFFVAHFTWVDVVYLRCCAETKNCSTRAPHGCTLVSKCVSCLFP